MGHPAVAPPPDRFLEVGGTLEVGLHRLGQKGRVLGGGAEEWAYLLQKRVGCSWVGWLL